ncbi:MAG TPA: right-handed parallel beta-helix repeat-containing protein, partial [Terriglobales bacterium]
MAVLAATASATTLYVTTTADSTSFFASDCATSTNTDCSLRSAIGAESAGDTIIFTGAGASGTIKLTGAALPVIVAATTVQGPGANQLTISGAGLYSIFILESGASLNISGLTLAHAQGTAIDFGATGSLTVANCAFVDNASTNNGAAIDTIAPATVTGSTFEGNSDSGAGGAIATTANLTVVNSTFWNNSTTHGGGAIMVYAGSASLNVSLTNDTFAGNSSASDGGAVLFTPTAGTLTADSDIFSNNSAAINGGGISSYAGATANIADAIYWNNVSAASPDCYACTTDGGVDVTSNPLTLPLALYGGTTPTLLPQPGSAAICAESALEATSAGLTSDQRGFSIASTCANGGID